ncbi:MAG: Asp-tRNA(Asn)/Glu-tRNA(Gln) amidotransferase subunit GatB [Candidatus Omnitrophota bacterium]
MELEVVIGLEVHLQLLTRTKAFCACSSEFGAPPNTHTCPVCLGFPGSLPVFNKTAFECAIKAALSLNCQIATMMKFDRKNYYYPDLPKNYQISQYDMPLASAGYAEVSQGKKKIRIKRAHIEEDAGKLIHDEKNGVSLVDYNRSGMPLLEIVSEPDINSPEEAHEYLSCLKSIFEYIEVSNCNMEEGSLRCDANISVRIPGEPLGNKVELKNMNSFKAVKEALHYESERQKNLLQNNEKVAQETRLWDEDAKKTVLMRSKEEAQDYRYFPEPDLVPFKVAHELIDAIRASIPELPKEKKERFIMQYNLPPYDAEVLTKDKHLAGFFEKCALGYTNPKVVSNWIMSELLMYINEHNLSITEIALEPGSLVELLKLIDSNMISGKIAKEVFNEMLLTRKEPLSIINEKGLTQILDEGYIGTVIEKVLKDHQSVVEDYMNGKKNAFIYLVGQVMKETKGRANPQKTNELLREYLGKKFKKI